MSNQSIEPANPEHQIDNNQPEPTEPSATPTKLTDVNIDCLQHIFNYLNLRDLLTIADANKSLRLAADEIFSRNYRKKTIFLRIMFARSIDLLEISDQKIEINDLKRSLQLIRCFGHLISKLEYDYSIDTFPKRRSEVDAYINEYCAQSLIQIEFFTITEQVFEHLKTSFENVKSVGFNYCTLGKYFSITYDSSSNRIFN